MNKDTLPEEKVTKVSAPVNKMALLQQSASKDALNEDMREVYSQDSKNA